ncbi:cytochrome P450 [Nonomuraea sp. NPDC050643]|uniref:cytochrome P450 n=1 Tax=Nonomuraea sp. NPDC050643 TaxID=3155660 RepID=UPI0033D33216
MDVDPFGAAFQHDPEPFYERLHAAGPVFLLDAYGIWATARHAETQHVIRDFETFCSSAGIGLANFLKEQPWRTRSLLLEADPPAHTSVRRAIARVMSPRAIEALRPEFERHADRLVGEAIRQGSFDAVTDLAQPYPLRVFADAVGITADDRENLLLYGDMVFNALGPRNRLFEKAMERAPQVTAWLTEQCRRDALRPGGLGAHLYEAADRGEITADEAALLIRSLLSAGIDTTVHGVAWTLRLLSVHPEVWDALRADPALVRPAFEESLRHASPAPLLFRTTSRETTLAGTRIPAGEKVLCFLGAANRDPRAWKHPDDFDLRRPAGHVSFGTGVHACVGAAMARFEAEILLTTLVRRVRTLAPAGDPVPRPNNWLRTLAHLPLRAA